MFSLVDLFQLLASSSRTGRLAVFHPEGEAQVYFDQGRVVHAEFTGLTGKEAVFALFADERGSFAFQMGAESPTESVTMGTDNLLLEIIRRLDEAKRDDEDGASASIANDVVPTLLESVPGASEPALTPEEKEMLQALDGERSVADIAQHTGASLASVKKLVTRLLEVGRVKVRSRKPRTARLVAQLSGQAVPAGSVGVAANIFETWERALKAPPHQVACRHPNGRIEVFGVVPAPDAGPYLLVSRETLFKSNMSVNMTLLVRPLSPADSSIG